MLDNNGNPIMAQGGGISKFGNTYYWYGVQYAEMTPYSQSGTVNTSSSTFVAINCYSSTDLVHWTFQNHSVSTSTPGFGHAGWVGRLGQVVYNSTNNQYIMWFEGLGGQTCCTCSTPTGNFVLNNTQGTITNVYFGPGAGDCTIFCDVYHGGTPYFICSDPHGRQHAYVCPLSSNYLTIGNAVAINDVAGVSAWPQGQEANNMFERNGVYYYTMSNLAGWSYSSAYEVNSTTIFVPTSYTVDAAYLGTTADFTHYSQVSFGFQVAGTVATNYIMVGDRWAQFINTYASAGHGQGFSIMCPITFTNNTPYFQSVNMFQVDAVTGNIRPATTAGTPINLTAAVGNAQAVLNWAALDGADAYNIYRSTTNGGPYAAIANPTTNNYTDSGLQNGTTYYYVIASTNVFGASTNSAQVSVTPSIGPLITAASASPNPVFPGNPVAITATVTPRANPIETVTVNASAIGGPTNQVLISNGAGNFTNTITVGPTTPISVQTLIANAADNLGNIASPFSFSLAVETVDETWDGGGGDNNWSDATNWVGNVAPGYGYSLIFAGATRPTPVMDGSNDLYAVTFDNTASSFVVTASSGRLTLTGGVTNNSPNSQDLDVPIVLGAPVTVNAAAAALTLGQSVANGGNLLTVADGGYATVLAGVVSGTGGFAKSGTGTNALYGNNTFTGNILITNGTLVVGSVPIGGSGQLGGGAYSGSVADNGTLTFNSAMAQTMSGIISGTGALNQIGTSSLALSAANTFSGPTVISGGTLQLSNSLALQNSTLNYNGGSVDFNGITTATLGGLSGGQNLGLINGSSAAVALTVGSNSLTTAYSGGMSGTGASLTKVGSGTLALTGTNSYTGSTTVDAGTLEIPAGGVINCGALGGGGFLLDGGTLISAGTTTFSPVNNAFLESTGAATLGSVTEPNNDGLLIKVTGGSFSASSLTLQRTAIFTTAPTATAPIAASTTSGLYVNGATAAVYLGMLTIGTGNSSDSVRVDSGMVVVTNEVLVGHTSNTRWEILQVNGGNFTSLDTVNGIVLSQNNGTTPNNSELYVSGGTLTAGKIAFGAASDTVGGNGFLIVNGGTLYLGSGGLVQPNATGYVSTISLTNGVLGATADWSSALSVQLTGTNFTFEAADASGAAHNILLSGTLSGPGNLTKTGSGVLTLSGTNTYAGTTTISGGTLLVNNAARSATGAGAVTVANGGTFGGNGIVSSAVTVNSGGALAPGNPTDVLTIGNNLTLAAGSSTFFQVQHSLLTNNVVNVTGTLTEGGVLNVTNVGLMPLAAGDVFKLFNAATTSGLFTSINLPPLPAGLAWNTNSLNTSGTLSVVIAATLVVGSLSISGTGLVFKGSGRVGDANFYLLGTTNLAAPLTNWTRLLTNQFDGNGNFNFTNAPNTNWPDNFYMLQIP